MCGQSFFDTGRCENFTRVCQCLQMVVVTWAPHRLIWPSSPSPGCPRVIWNWGIAAMHPGCILQRYANVLLVCFCGLFRLCRVGSLSPLDCSLQSVFWVCPGTILISSCNYLEFTCHCCPGWHWLVFFCASTTLFKTSCMEKDRHAD